MNHDILKEVIFDQHEIIKKTKIVPRDYDFDLNANYVLIGLRRAGKSTLLYKIVKDLVEKGIEWNQIIYINFLSIYFFVIVYYRLSILSYSS